MSDTDGTWRNRIVGHGEEDPEQLVANPKNWRIHPQRQQAVLAGAINDVGYLRSVTVNRRNGFVLDGHLRVTLAMRSGQRFIPVEYVDLSEAEEAEALASLDPISALAVPDYEQLGALMRDIEHADVAVSELLAEMYDVSAVPMVADQEEPAVSSKVLVEISCSRNDLLEFTPTLDVWAERDSVTVNVS